MTYSEALACYLFGELKKGGLDIDPDAKLFFSGPIKIMAISFNDMLVINDSIKISKQAEALAHIHSQILDNIYQTLPLKDCYYYENCNCAQPNPEDQVQTS